MRYLLVCLAHAALALSMSTSRRGMLADEVRGLFKHGFEGYMTYAYPADELRPITCAPLWRDPDTSNIGVNDIHANVSMTLIDSLSALHLILPEEWPDAVEKVATSVSFDQDVKVQVFEMTIRALGALLSTYQRLESLPIATAKQGAALGLDRPVDVKRYAPKILDLAIDLAQRLLPAFKSPTGLPYARVNLRRGVERGESTETCSAGAGSLILEFTLLSRLTGDSTYETLARRAFMAIWNRRTPQDLVGNNIEIAQGRWLPPAVSGVHAGIDSFFELTIDDSSFMDIFNDAYAAIQMHVRTTDGFFYRPVHLSGLTPTSPSYIDSLSAFFPGVQVLAGDIESAIRGHLVFWNIWRKYSAMPESWDVGARKVGWGGWPGRPEFIESTYYLHRATGDDFYLRVGERVLADIKERTMTSCGFARLANVETGETDDRMESFMLSETLKYLYLLFDPTPEPPVSNTVFTTEGHPLTMTHEHVPPPTAAWHASHRREDLYCPVYEPPIIGGIPVGIEGRDDYDYIRTMVFGPAVDSFSAEVLPQLWGDGMCAKQPHVPKFTFELILTPAELPLDAPLPAHDPSPSIAKVYQTPDGHWVIANIDGLRLNVRFRLDGWGYDVVTIGPHRVRQGQQVTITDTRMEGYLPTSIGNVPYALSSVNLSFSRDGATPFVSAQATTALFGRPFTNGWGLDKSLPLVVADLACAPLGNTPTTPFVLLVNRGECTFVQKAQRAAQAGAVGLIIANLAQPPDGESIVRPSALGESEEVLHQLLNISVALIPHSTAQTVRDLLKRTNIYVHPSSLDPEPFHGEKRQGRLVVDDYEIVNMLVVEAP